MKPKRQKLASLAQKICILLFHFFGAVVASKGYPFKNIYEEVNFCHLLSRLHIFLGRLDFIANTMIPDQTAPISGLIVVASIMHFNLKCT